MISWLKKYPFPLWSVFFWYPCMLTFSLFLGYLSWVYFLFMAHSSLQRNLGKWEEKQFLVWIRGLVAYWNFDTVLCLLLLLSFLAGRVKQWIILTISWVHAIYNTMFVYILEWNREFLMQFRPSSPLKFWPCLLKTRNIVINQSLAPWSDLAPWCIWLIDNTQASLFT